MTAADILVLHATRGRFAHTASARWQHCRCNRFPGRWRSRSGSGTEDSRHAVAGALLRYPIEESRKPPCSLSSTKS